MKRLAITREKELNSVLYWRNVDGISKEILRYRYQKGYSEVKDLVTKIDKAVSYVEADLEKIFN